MSAANADQPTQRANRTANRTTSLDRAIQPKETNQPMPDDPTITANTRDVQTAARQIQSAARNELQTAIAVGDVERALTAATRLHAASLVIDAAPNVRPAPSLPPSIGRTHRHS